MNTNYKLQCGCMLQDEMTAFDSLPEQVRVAITASPLGTCAREVIENCAAFGAENFLRELTHAEEQLRRNTDQSTRV